MGPITEFYIGGSTRTSLTVLGSSGPSLIVADPVASNGITLDPTSKVTITYDGSVTLSLSVFSTSPTPGTSKNAGLLVIEVPRSAPPNVSPSATMQSGNGQPSPTQTSHIGTPQVSSRVQSPSPPQNSPGSQNSFQTQSAVASLTTGFIIGSSPVTVTIQTGTASPTTLVLDPLTSVPAYVIQSTTTIFATGSQATTLTYFPTSPTNGATATLLIESTPSVAASSTANMPTSGPVQPPATSQSYFIGSTTATITIPPSGTVPGSILTLLPLTSVPSYIIQSSVVLTAFGPQKTTLTIFPTSPGANGNIATLLIENTTPASSVSPTIPSNTASPAPSGPVQSPPISSSSPALTSSSEYYIGSVTSSVTLPGGTVLTLLPISTPIPPYTIQSTTSITALGSQSTTLTIFPTSPSVNGPNTATILVEQTSAPSQTNVGSSSVPNTVSPAPGASSGPMNGASQTASPSLTTPVNTGSVVAPTSTGNNGGGIGRFVNRLAGMIASNCRR